MIHIEILSLSLNTPNLFSQGLPLFYQFLLYTWRIILSKYKKKNFS